MQIVAQVPSQGKAVGDHPHELPLAPQILEEHDELELEEHDRVHRGPAGAGVEWGGEVPDEREIEGLLQPTIRVIVGDELFEGEVG